MATNSRYFLGIFDTEEKLLQAVKSVRSGGYAIHDCYTPYAVHGLDQAMGMRNTRFAWASFIGGLTGFATAIALEVWTSAINWPINVGGKPFISLPAFIPIIFELTVLLTGLTSLLAFLVVCGLKPSLEPLALGQYRATNDRFILAVGTQGNFSEIEIKAHLAELGATESTWYEEN